MSQPSWLTHITCPKCQGKLTQIENATGLLCAHDQLVFPVRDGIPIMLMEQAVVVDHQA
ncbi:Trm112 family protein [Formosimonas limnophila]|uniref:Trm112 family protein n=1 Tax=Formosimonas limnophila TaxID=1384487 RepID=UPI003571107D